MQGCSADGNVPYASLQVNAPQSCTGHCSFKRREGEARNPIMKQKQEVELPCSRESLIRDCDGAVSSVSGKRQNVAQGERGGRTPYGAFPR